MEEKLLPSYSNDFFARETRARARRGNRTLRDTIESEKRHMNHFDYRLRRIKSTGKPHIHHYAKYWFLSIPTYISILILITCSRTLFLMNWQKSRSRLQSVCLSKSLTTCYDQTHSRKQVHILIMILIDRNSPRIIFEYSISPSTTASDKIILADPSLSSERDATASSNDMNKSRSMRIGY